MEDVAKEKWMPVCVESICWDLEEQAQQAVSQVLGTGGY